MVRIYRKDAMDASREDCKVAKPVPSPSGRYVRTRARVRTAWSAISPHPPCSINMALPLGEGTDFLLLCSSTERREQRRE